MRYTKLLLVIGLLLIIGFFSLCLHSFCTTISNEDLIIGDKKMNDGLQFNIEVPKIKFNYDETINIKGLLKNITTHSFYINKSFLVTGDNVEPKEYGIALKIIDPRNKKIKFRIYYETTGPAKDWFVQLGPQEIFAENIQVVIKSVFPEKGKFKITGYYYNFIGEEFGLPNIWKGSVESNEVEIQIE